MTDMAGVAWLTRCIINDNACANAHACAILMVINDE